MEPVLSEAREKLNSVTPLKTDCGRVCGARCCAPLEGETTGMLLFPGEAEAYAGRAGWIIRDVPQGQLVICSDACEREERPLACRMFPLLPLLREDGTVRAVTDQRARAVCPLARQGKSAMDPAFIEAVRAAGETLAKDGEQAAFLRELAKEQEELKELRRMLGGGKRV